MSEETVECFNEPRGITTSCSKCLQVLKTGTWVVRILMQGHTFLVGCNPPVICCGEEKKVIDAFQSEPEAEQLARIVREELSRVGVAPNLKVYEARKIPLLSNARH